MSQKDREQREKQLLNLEAVLGTTGTLSFATLVISSVFVVEKYPLVTLTMICVGFVIFFITSCCCLKIEQIAGFYKCRACGHKHTPAYRSVFLAFHIGRTRHLRCPKCGKKTWQKKVL